MKIRSLTFSAFLLGALTALESQAATLTVGPGKTFATPCQAIQGALSGDIIEIDAAGSYAGDVCAIYPSQLTIRGVGGRAVMDAAGRSAEGKGIWVIKGSNTVIENIEFKNAKVVDKNGAGIRLEGTNLTVRNSYFHHNENGILTGANANSEVLIERSEFGFNGASDGYSHNMYIGHIKKFTLLSSFSHDAYVGHLVKSRAQENHILYNRLTNENNGNASYEVDLPNGGRSYVIGNVIHQGPSASNSAMLSFAAEGATNTANDFYLVNNTFVNDRSSGYFVNINSAVAPAPVAKNNIFAGTGQVFNNSTVINQNNHVSTSPSFVSRSTYDYRPAAGAAFINTGINPGTSLTGVSLTPNREYVHPLQTKTRAADAAIDAGAFEYVSTTTTPTPEPTPEPTPTPTPTPSPVPDTLAPQPTITAPANGQSVTRNSTVTITATATDNIGVSRVDITVNGTLLCQRAAAPYSCAWKVPAANGKTYSIQATALDKAGNRGSSSIIKVYSR